ERVDLPAELLERTVVADDDVRDRGPIGGGELRSDTSARGFAVHPSRRSHPLDLRAPARADDDDQVEHLSGADLGQQRNVDDDDLVGVLQLLEPVRYATHHFGVCYLVQQRELGWIVEHDLPETRAV